MNSETTPSYEDRLRTERAWAMDEGDRHFRGEDQVFDTLRRFTRRLEEFGIPYAVCGALALEAHGYRRLTVDVDILVTREGLARIHEQFSGRGYLPVFTGSKNLRDTQTGVRIEFLITGGFPRDGLPKPVAFPEPEQVGIALDGIRYLDLPRLVELKLASGMTNPGRLKDLADVQEVIRALNLPPDFESRLDPFVQVRFRELWSAVHDDKLEP
jgi:hypothetical protein